MTGASNRLMGLTKELRADWDRTKQYWGDAKSAEFEKRFLDELFAGVNQATNNIETLERILAKISDDCE
ncbi:MAG: hypothetical protein MUC65_10315 [Pontiellaceae bacterium]|jgi:hypothetical protein|nr:hypothetical protein [Pontiellaceae bacterium]